ncbi:MAG TPA: 2Fe-2S iron-sulfur cluster-binding protein [Telluria sp.]
MRTPSPPVQPFHVTIEPGGCRFDAAAGATLLHAAELAGISLPSSCRNGTCRTCLCRLTAGSVRYLIEWPGLSVDEKRAGYTLPCVAVPESDVVLDAPLARRPLPG